MKRVSILLLIQQEDSVTETNTHTLQWSNKRRLQIDDLHKSLHFSLQAVFLPWSPAVHVPAGRDCSTDEFSPKECCQMCPLRVRLLTICILSINPAQSLAAGLEPPPKLQRQDFFLKDLFIWERGIIGKIIVIKHHSKSWVFFFF